MSDPILTIAHPRPVPRPDRPTIPVGRQLVEAGLIDQGTLVNALHLQRYIDAPLGEILVSLGAVDRTDVLDALAVQYAAQRVDLHRDPPPYSMVFALPMDVCQRFGVVPWRRVDKALLVATDRPDRLHEIQAALPEGAPALLPVIAGRQQIHDQIGRLHGRTLAQRAITRLPAELSCRGWKTAKDVPYVGVALCVGLALFAVVVFPVGVLTVGLLASLLSLLLIGLLKLGALLAQLVGGISAGSDPLRRVPLSRLPRISVMVPLFREEDIAGALIERLSRLTYPKALLEVVLVLEAKDHVTRAVLARTRLPQWMRVVEVPDDGTITTKPRALNYALDFCSGTVIGVWDAEDAPEPDQLEKVVAQLARAAPNVACVQGALDYYNPRQNPLARCFTIEYATWWRLMLPGIARLGLVLPLGGTTLFFRREILEELGGWDAHNVTEDADLGLRLARAGYVTELAPTVTMEEANCHLWGWVKQRSRWLKGFFITWCVHMRKPVQLWRDLGTLRFLGVQALFLGTVVQFTTMPLLWSFLLPMFGVPHPMLEALGPGLIWPIFGLLITTELLNLSMAALAVAAPTHRHLLPWVLALPLYFPLASVAAAKAVYELVAAPFYWDKTRHGSSLEDCDV